MLASIYPAYLALASLVFATPSPRQGACTGLDHSDKFTLNAIYADGTGPVPLKFIDSGTVPHVGWALLTACPSCSNSFAYSTLAAGVWHPYASEYQKPVSWPLIAGESPSFISEYPYPTGWAGYCATDDGFLGVNDDASLWSLCTNQTSGRLDVVYSPVASHAHYVANDCASVKIELVDV
ncbi:hypothetical protein BD626DRAFT_488872 [Schizophyllum amplum]|uniref:Uncharacterized protein n=1 Tax=Schizophyllum amplum TaxID=97359 RepID=A0A550CKY6_9AGAR|nr:hypothetical protein BD626DRAFT_488872 [Auriculariopsis ampla]